MKHIIPSLLVAVVLAIVLACAWLGSRKRDNTNVRGVRFVRFGRRLNRNPRTLLGLMRWLLALPERVCVAVLRFYSDKVRYRKAVEFANIAEGEHEGGRITFLAGSVWTTRFIFVKRGADSQHVIPCSATTDNPIGVCYDIPDAIGDPLNVCIIGGSSDKTLKVISAYAGTMGDAIQTDANGNAILWAAGGYASGRLLADVAVGDNVEFTPHLSLVAHV